MHKTIKYLLLIFLFAQSGSILGQTETDTSETSAIKIYNSNFYEFRGDLDPPEEHYKGDVKMTHDSVYMFADTSILSLDYMDAVGNIVIIQEDTIRLFADSLYYDTKDGKAQLFYNVVLENGKQQLFTERLDYYTKSKIAVYPDTALLQNDRTKLSSLRGKYDMNAALATFAGEVIVIDEEFTLTADSLLYNTDIDKAIFVGPTNIDQENRKIYCESGYYDIQNGQASFEQNANYVEGDQVASANKIKYNEATGEVTLIGNAKYKDKEKNATAQRMVYDENTKDIILTGDAYFYDGESTATGDEIKYNEESGEVSILGKALIDGDETRIEANNSKFDEARGVGVFEGDVAFLSKTDSVSVFSDILEVDNESKINIATGESRPHMLRFVDGDSLYLSADTLYVQERIDSIFVIERIDTSIVQVETMVEVKPKEENPKEEKPQGGLFSEEKINAAQDSLEDIKPEGKREKPSRGSRGKKNKSDEGTNGLEKPVRSSEEEKKDEEKVYETVMKDSMVFDTIMNFTGLDTVNVFKAYKDVRILSEEFQAISDSMYYDNKDSLFVLFQNPIMWSDSMQFTGDTISIKLADAGVETVYLNGRAMINEFLKGDHYNQIKAKYIEAWIDSSSISFMEMRQNAESNYYIMDDEDAFIGLNHTLCNLMNFYFEGGEMSDIKFFEQPTSILTPVQQLTREQLFLKDFSWELDLKPNTLEDLLKAKEISEISAILGAEDDLPKGDVEIKEEGENPVEEVKEPEPKSNVKRNN